MSADKKCQKHRFLIPITLRARNQSHPLTSMDVHGTKVITNKLTVTIQIKLSQPIKMWGITHLLKS